MLSNSAAASYCDRKSSRARSRPHTPGSGVAAVAGSQRAYSSSRPCKVSLKWRNVDCSESRGIRKLLTCSESALSVNETKLSGAVLTIFVDAREEPAAPRPAALSAGCLTPASKDSYIEHREPSLSLTKLTLS